MPKLEFAQGPVTISSDDTLKLTTQTLKDYFPLSIDGHKYTDETIFHILVKASVNANTIEDTCDQLEEAPSSNTVRYHLKEGLLGETEFIENRINQALLEHLPPEIKGKKQEVAIDLTFIPYHGEAYFSDDEISRGQAKKGTTHFHCYTGPILSRRIKG